MSSQYIEIPSHEVEIEIDADEIIDEASSKISEIAEQAIEDYDLTDAISNGVELELDNQLTDKITEFFGDNPATMLNAIVKALDWAEERQVLVLDQSKAMKLLQQEKVELETKLQQYEDLLTAPPLKETNADL